MKQLWTFWNFLGNHSTKVELIWDFIELVVLIVFFLWLYYYAGKPLRKQNKLDKLLDLPFVIWLIFLLLAEWLLRDILTFIRWLSGIHPSEPWSDKADVVVLILIVIAAVALSVAFSIEEALQRGSTKGVGKKTGRDTGTVGQNGGRKEKAESEERGIR